MSSAQASRGASSAAGDAERLLADAVRSLGDAVVTADLQGRITSWNAGAEALFGWPADEVVGGPLSVLFPGGAGPEPVSLGPLDAGLLETERIHRDGRRVAVSLRVTRLFTADGTHTGTVCLARDLGPELAVRRELDLARRQVHESWARSVLAQLTVSPAGVVTAVNDALLALSGYDREELLGRPYEGFLVREDLDAVAEAWTERRPRGVRRRVRSVRRADGAVVEALVSLVPVRDEEGGLVRVELALEDISDTLAAERSMRDSEARWRSLAQRSTDVAFLLDAQAQVLFATPAVRQHFGYDEAQVVGTSGLDWTHPDDLPVAVAAWGRAVAGTGTETFRVRLRHADGVWRWVEQTVTDRLADPAVHAVVVNIVDITGALHAEQQLVLLTDTDQLTGLLSRTAIVARLERALADPAARTALVVADLDGFRVVNASHGHAAGDEVLTAVAERLAGVARRAEALGRIAGDRFALVLTAMDDPSEVDEVVQRIAAVLREPVTVRGAALEVTATVAAVLGVAADPSVTVDSATLVDAAEAALAAARTDGRSRVRVEPAVRRSKVVARHAVVDGLRRALQRDELVVHYQPVIDLRSGRVRGAEALVRWEHPQRGLLQPAEFIDAAEDSGQIVDLGAQVLRRACVLGQRWSAGAGGPDFRVSVNLSARQIADADVVRTVADALGSSGCASRNLVLEVTESAVMADVDAARATLEELRGLGVELSVDDFGTGYSSLTYLKHFPVSALKVDRSFVAGLGTDADDTAIVTSVISLAATIGLDCVAEGVETRAQTDVLLELGCAAGQGFVWARPMEDAVLDRFLVEHREVPLLVGSGAPVAGAPAVRPSRRLDERVLARMLEMEAEGASLHTIAAALNSEGVPTAEGKRWHARSVARVVQSLHAG